MKPGNRKPHNNKNDELVKSIKSLTDGFNNFKTEFNNFKNEFYELRNDVNEVKQEVKNINNRLDYIVKANKLKDIPNK